MNEPAPTPEQKKAAQVEGGVFNTPLRYPGGKGRLGPWLAQVLRHNKISGGWYVEPYAGGAGAALYLLTHGYVERIVINDADPVIYSFWKSVTERNQALIKLIRTTPVTMKTWEKQKEILAAPENHDLLKVGFAAFFLNRTNRSGILEAGVIGGKDQTGPYKIDARYNIDALVHRIENIGNLAPRMTVLGMDALDLLMDSAPGFPKKCLVYLDPPYYVKGSQLYRNHYTHDDHAAIAYCVGRAKYPVLVTYDNSQEISDLYSGMDTQQFSLHYSTHLARPKATELLFYKNLQLPNSPTMTRGYQLTQQARTKQPNSSQIVLSL